MCDNYEGNLLYRTFLIGNVRKNFLSETDKLVIKHDVQASWIMTDINKFLGKGIPNKVHKKYKTKKSLSVLRFSYAKDQISYGNT